MTLEAIMDAIQHLPEEERRQLAGWFEAMEEAAWDEEIKRDFAPGGKGERLAKEIHREISEGTARPSRGPRETTPLPFVTFRSLALPRFWDLYDRLPEEIQAQADKQYALFAENPGTFRCDSKPVGPFWSVARRISDRTVRSRCRRPDLVLDRTHADYARLLVLNPGGQGRRRRGRFEPALLQL